MDVVQRQIRRVKADAQTAVDLNITQRRHQPEIGFRRCFFDRGDGAILDRDRDGIARVVAFDEVLFSHVCSIPARLIDVRQLQAANPRR